MLSKFTFFFYDNFAEARAHKLITTLTVVLVYIAQARTLTSFRIDVTPVFATLFGWKNDAPPVFVTLSISKIAKYSAIA